MKIKLKDGIKCDFKKIEDEYAYDEFFGGAKLLEVLNQMTKAEKRLLILYAELGTYSGVARILNISHTSAGNEVKKLVKKFIKLYDEYDS